MSTLIRTQNLILVNAIPVLLQSQTSNLIFCLPFEHALHCSLISFLEDRVRRTLRQHAPSSCFKLRYISETFVYRSSFFITSARSILLLLWSNLHKKEVPNQDFSISPLENLLVWFCKGCSFTLVVASVWWYGRLIKRRIYLLSWYTCIQWLYSLLPSFARGASNLTLNMCNFYATSFLPQICDCKPPEQFLFEKPRLSASKSVSFFKQVSGRTIWETAFSEWI